MALVAMSRDVSRRGGHGMGTGMGMGWEWGFDLGLRALETVWSAEAAETEMADGAVSKRRQPPTSFPIASEASLCLQ